MGTNKTYTLTLKCGNCGETFNKEIPFGVDAERTFYPSRVYLDQGTIPYEYIECPNCGSRNIAKQI